jgi:hypothetical protein
LSGSTAGNRLRWQSDAPSPQRARDTTGPSAEAAEVFAAFRHHYETRRALKPEMLEAADRELQAGTTVGQLAAWTGLTPEVFRRRARALGVERKRPPTVGRLAGPTS